MRLGELLSKRGLNYFYIMHLSYDGEERERLWNYAKENDIIGLDYPDEVRDDWNRVRESVRDKIPRIWVRQFDMFCNEMREGDIVVTLEGWFSLLGVAEVVKGYEYQCGLYGSEEFFDHVRRVRWIKKHDYGKHPRLQHPIEGFRNTLYRVEPSTRRWKNLFTADI